MSSKADARATLALAVFITLSVSTEGRCGADSPDVAKPVPSVTARLLEVNVSDQHLRVRYQIANASGEDIWMCNDLASESISFETSLIQDTQTLRVHRLINAPGMHGPAGARYIRLPAGRDRIESVVLPLPVHLSHSRVKAYKLGPNGLIAPPEQPAQHVLIEINYCSGNLPEMQLTSLIKLQDLRRDQLDPDSARLVRWSALQSFNENCERSRNRREQVEVYPNGQNLASEHTLQIKVDDVSIPYSDDYRWEAPWPQRFKCTRMEIQFQPSMLEYFYPYAGEQSLLTAAEKETLSSRDRVVLNDRDLLSQIRGQIREGRACGIVVEGPTARMECYASSGRTESMTFYGDEDFESRIAGARFRCYGGISMLRAAVPLIHRLDLRRDCAKNLTNLWFRFRLYERMTNPSIAPADRKPAYPAPATWCDDMVRAYAPTGMSADHMKGAFACPGVEDCEWHYAMNPDCVPGSPADTVLLFETEAGWNQHGGAELFTFDNHDPKGGLVLLNDGTVKFVRTRKELKQLRWK